MVLGISKSLIVSNVRERNAIKSVKHSIKTMEITYNLLVLVIFIILDIIIVSNTST